MNNKKNLLLSVSYMTWIGFLIAFALSDRKDSFVVHHLNQAFFLNIVSIIGFALREVPQIGSNLAWVVTTLAGVYLLLGIVRAASGRENPIPVIGEIHILG